ncbi:unnamed protein product, partial [Ectocarpus sp. 13 AM-2016]
LRHQTRGVSRYGHVCSGSRGSAHNNPWYCAVTITDPRASLSTQVDKKRAPDRNWSVRRTGQERTGANASVRSRRTRSMCRRAYWDIFPKKQHQHPITCSDDTESSPSDPH